MGCFSLNGKNVCGLSSEEVSRLLLLSSMSAFGQTNTSRARLLGKMLLVYFFRAALVCRFTKPNLKMCRPTMSALVVYTINVHTHTDNGSMPPCAHTQKHQLGVCVFCSVCSRLCSPDGCAIRTSSAASSLDACKSLPINYGLCWRCWLLEGDPLIDAAFCYFLCCSLPASVRPKLIINHRAVVVV